MALVLKKEKISQPTHNSPPQLPIPKLRRTAHSIKHRANTAAVLRQVKRYQVSREGGSAERSQEKVNMLQAVLRSFPQHSKTAKWFPYELVVRTPSEKVLTSKVHADFLSRPCNLAHKLPSPCAVGCMEAPALDPF